MNLTNRCFLVVFLLSASLVTSLSAQDQAGQMFEAPRPNGLETVEFFSPAVNRMMKFDIVFPTGYWETEDHYPVLYLLHGYMQNYTVWGRNLAAAFYARNINDLILVLPDGGNS